MTDTQAERSAFDTWWDASQVHIDGEYRHYESCWQAARAELLLENYRLKNALIKLHKQHCTVDNCVLDGGSEHIEGFKHE